jgi:hypothetical protein
MRVAANGRTVGIWANGIVGDLSVFRQPALWLYLETDAPSARERHIALPALGIDDKW